MIKKVEVVVSFINGASFNSNVNEIIYKKMITFIHSISCMCVKHKCNLCTQRQFCRYFKITGENFQGYPALLIENSVFEKRKFCRGEDKKFVFYLIGSMEVYSDYITVFFTNLNQEIGGNFFMIKKYCINDLEQRDLKVKKMQITSPILSCDFGKQYNKMVSYYNKHYSTNFSLMEKNIILKNEKHIIWGELKLKTKKIFVQGYTGYVIENEEFIVDSCLLFIGCGKFNLIGGGSIEIEDYLEM